MRKFIRSIALFIPFAIVIYIVFTLIWGSFVPQKLNKNLNYRIGTYGHMFTRLQEAKNVREVDFLVLGSSHAYRGFDPRVFSQHGLVLFNLGSSNQTPIQSEILLKRFLKTMQPSRVIIEVNPFYFANDGVESSVDIIANSRNDLLSIKMALTINNQKTYNTLIYGLFRDLVGLNKSYVEKEIKSEDTYITGGYVERQHETLQWKPTILESQAPNEKQTNAFSNIILMLHEMKIPLLLVQSPITQELYKTYENRVQFDQEMRQSSTYINFNLEPALNDTLHFYDPEHMNQKGVEIFNQQLIFILQDSVLNGYNVQPEKAAQKAR